MKILCSFLILALTFSGCSSTRGSHASGETQAQVNTSSHEVQIGEQIHAQIISTFTVYSDPQMNSYLNQVGQSVSRHAERKELPYRFTILYNEKIYATSAPGGYIYLTTGMVNFVDNEAELAAVIAHEIGELQYRDPRMSKSLKALSEVTRVGAAVAPAFGQIGMLAALGLVMVSFVVDSRTKVKPPEEKMIEADRRTLNYLMKSGYDPQALMDVFHKFLNANGQTIPYFYDYYQSRPITKERVVALESEFQKLSLQDKTLTTNYKIFQENTKDIREIYRR